MWIRFGSGYHYPFAVKVATGKVCALTGEAWVPHLNDDPQDYAVLPEQPWLDGYCVDKGVVRQFVAMPLGEGYTVEEQLTDAARHGGVQIVAYPMKRERYEALIADRPEGSRYRCRLDSPPCGEGMGLAPGGRMRQEVHDDPHGLDAWDQRHASRCFVTIANAAQWLALVGERPPNRPPTAKSYTEAGLPWFDDYDGDAEALAGGDKLKAVASVARFGREKGAAPLPDNETLDVTRVVGLRKRGAHRVREFSDGDARA